MTHNNSQRNAPNYSAEVEALSEVSIMSVTAKSQQQSSGRSDGQRKRPRWQKPLDEFFGGRDKRRVIQDPMSSPVAFMRKVVEPKGKGRRKTSIGAVYAYGGV